MFFLFPQKVSRDKSNPRFWFHTENLFQCSSRFWVRFLICVFELFLDSLDSFVWICEWSALSRVLDFEISVLVTSSVLWSTEELECERDGALCWYSKIANRYLFHSISKWLTTKIILFRKTQKDIVKSYLTFVLLTPEHSHVLPPHLGYYKEWIDLLSS